MLTRDVGLWGYVVMTRLDQADTLHTGYNFERLYLDYTDTGEGRISLIFENKTFQDTISLHYPSQPACRL